MASKLSETQSKAILGVSGSNVHNGQIRADEFLPELRGKKAIRTYQQMGTMMPLLALSFTLLSKSFVM